MDFVKTAALLRARVYGLVRGPGSLDDAKVRAVLDTMIIPEFKPRANVKIQVSDEQPVAATPVTEGIGVSLIF